MNWFIPPVFAAEIFNPALPTPLGSGGNTQGPNIVGALMARFFAAGLAIGAIAFLMYLVYGAFRWLTSGEDKAQLQAAKNTMTQALIGLTILASIFAIARVVGALLGLNCGGASFPDVICWPTVP